jgi:hypothetical protein
MQVLRVATCNQLRRYINSAEGILQCVSLSSERLEHSHDYGGPTFQVSLVTFCPIAARAMRTLRPTTASSHALQHRRLLPRWRPVVSH